MQQMNEEKAFEKLLELQKLFLFTNPEMSSILSLFCITLKEMIADVCKQHKEIMGMMSRMLDIFSENSVDAFDLARAVGHTIFNITNFNSSFDKLFLPQSREFLERLITFIIIETSPFRAIISTGQNGNNIILRCKSPTFAHVAWNESINIEENDDSRKFFNSLASGLTALLQFEKKNKDTLVFKPSPEFIRLLDEKAWIDTQDPFVCLQRYFLQKCNAKLTRTCLGILVHCL